MSATSKLLTPQWRILPARLQRRRTPSSVSVERHRPAPVQQVEVEPVGPQAPQAAPRRRRPCRRGVALLRQHLADQEDLVAAPGDRLADELLGARRRRTSRRCRSAPSFCTSRRQPHVERLSAYVREWRGPDLNRRHRDFQSRALPAELPRQRSSSIPAGRAPEPRPDGAPARARRSRSAYASSGFGSGTKALRKSRAMKCASRYFLVFLRFTSRSTRAWLCCGSTTKCRTRKPLRA